MQFHLAHLTCEIHTQKSMQLRNYGIFVQPVITVPLVFEVMKKWEAAIIKPPSSPYPITLKMSRRGFVSSIS